MNDILELKDGHKIKKITFLPVIRVPEIVAKKQRMNIDHLACLFFQPTFHDQNDNEKYSIIAEFEKSDAYVSLNLPKYATFDIMNYCLLKRINNLPRWYGGALK